MDLFHYISSTDGDSLRDVGGGGEVPVAKEEETTDIGGREKERRKRCEGEFLAKLKRLNNTNRQGTDSSVL